MQNKFIGLIGVGYWGKNLLRNLHSLDALVGCYDSSSQNLEKLSNEYTDVIFFKNLDDLFNNKDIIAVCIATPAVTHGDMVIKALNAGKHVFVEKPMCLDIEQAKQIIKLSEILKLKLMVGHLLLYHPAFIALSKIIEQKKLGDLRYLYSTRLSLGKFRKEENALWSFAPHDISMILSLVKDEPITVNAFGGSYLTDSIADTSITMLKFSSNIKAHIFVSWLHPYKDQRLIVIGDKAMAVFQDTLSGPEKLMIYKHKAKWDGELPVLEKANGEPVFYDQNLEPLKEECQAFINLVRQNKVPPSDGNEGLRVLRVLKEADRDLKKREKNV